MVRGWLSWLERKGVPSGAPWDRAYPSFNFPSSILDRPTWVCRAGLKTCPYITPPSSNSPSRGGETVTDSGNVEIIWVRFRLMIGSQTV